jgi:hypothetical protein
MYAAPVLTAMPKVYCQRHADLGLGAGTCTVTAPVVNVTILTLELLTDHHLTWKYHFGKILSINVSSVAGRALCSLGLGLLAGREWIRIESKAIRLLARLSPASAAFHPLSQDNVNAQNGMLSNLEVPWRCSSTRLPNGTGKWISRGWR